MPHPALRRVRDTFALIAAAGRASSAVQASRAPARRDLETLGLDPDAFANLRR